MIAFLLLMACSGDAEKVEVTEEKAQTEKTVKTDEQTESKGPSVKTETPVKQKTVETVDLEIEVKAPFEETTTDSE